MSRDMDDSDRLLFCDEPAQPFSGAAHGDCWKILIVDDEESVHLVTKLVLGDVEFEGRRLEFLSAFSAEEAKRAIVSHPDIAVIFLDVVMEREDSGFEVVRYIREELGNDFVRILMRTGQPGVAPPEQVIVDYDINDYLDKSELTAQRLFTTLISSLRAYRNIVSIASVSKQLEQECRERFQAETAFQETQQQLQAMMDNSPAVIYAKDRQGRYLFVNREFERLFHIDKQTIVGMADSDFLPPDTAAAFRENDSRVLVTGKALEREEVVPLEDGLHTYISVKFPLFNRDGSYSAVCGVSTDITERKKADEALAAEKELLAVTLRSIGDGVIASDMEGRVVLMNREAEHLTGWSHQEAAGRLLTDVFVVVDERFRQPCENPMGRILGSGGMIDQQICAVLITKDGRERIIAETGAPIRDQESRIIGVVLVFRDITEKRKMEEDLLRSQKLESVGVLAGGLAHDFNNLLAAILGNISLAKMFLQAQNQVYELIENAEKASLRAKDLTGQLLTFSKGGAPVRKTASAGELIRETAQFAVRGSNVRCKIAIADDLPPVEIDEGQISQVIHNLIINAEQAMPVGGTIEVTCDEVVLPESETQPLPAGRYLCITVTDEGVGIPPTHLQRIFDPYFTTKDTGRGLGLAAVYSIIRNHGGTISVESDLGKSTTFTVYLPVSEKQCPTLTAEDKTVPAGHGRVLVMDDDEVVREVGGKILQHLGYEVDYARDGKEAIEIFQNASGAGRPYDVIIVDLTIPGGMGGKETVARLRQFDPSVKAIVSSGYSNDPVLSDFRHYGFSGVISKPYQVIEMAKTLAAVLGREQDATG